MTRCSNLRHHRRPGRRGFDHLVAAYPDHVGLRRGASVNSRAEGREKDRLVRYPEGTLTLDVVDVASHRIVWRAPGDDAIEVGEDDSLGRNSVSGPAYRPQRSALTFRSSAVTKRCLTAPTAQLDRASDYEGQTGATGVTPRATDGNETVARMAR